MGKIKVAVSKGRQNTKLGMPLKILISDGNVHDSQCSEALIKDFKAQSQIAGKDYDSKYS